MRDMQKKFQLEDFLKATSGRVLQRHQTEAIGVSTDTRKNVEGSLFFCLKGENFDGHNFLNEIAQKKAAIAVVEKEIKSESADLTVVLVKSVDQALADFARFERRKRNIPVLAITGSNGKTTTKEYTAQILSLRGPVLSPQGSFNNHWGVPLTLLSGQDEQWAYVIEIGMNHLHEIESLVQVSEPTAVVCTMVGTAHIGHLGSQANVAQAKEEIYKFAPESAQKIFNLDNQWTKAMYDRARARGNCRTFSMREDAGSDFYAELMSDDTIRLRILGQSFQIPSCIQGVHNLTNLLSSIALASSAGLSPQEIVSALQNLKTAAGRMQMMKSSQQADVLFDAYNANIDSVKALLKYVEEKGQARRLIGVFGELKEVGDFAEDIHFEYGQQVGKMDFEKIFYIGAHGDAFERGIRDSKFSKTLKLSNTYELKLATELASMLRISDLVVMKASRSIGLEKFLPSLGLSFKGS